MLHFHVSFSAPLFLHRNNNVPNPPPFSSLDSLLHYYPRI